MRDVGFPNSTLIACCLKAPLRDNPTIYRAWDAPQGEH